MLKRLNWSPIYDKTPEHEFITRNAKTSLFRWMSIDPDRDLDFRLKELQLLLLSKEEMAKLIEKVGSSLACHTFYEQDLGGYTYKVPIMVIKHKEHPFVLMNAHADEFIFNPLGFREEEMFMADFYRGLVLFLHNGISHVHYMNSGDVGDEWHSIFGEHTANDIDINFFIDFDGRNPNLSLYAVKDGHIGDEIKRYDKALLKGDIDNYLHPDWFLDKVNIGEKVYNLRSGKHEQIIAIDPDPNKTYRIETNVRTYTAKGFQSFDSDKEPTIVLEKFREKHIQTISMEDEPEEKFEHEYMLSIDTNSVEKYHIKSHIPLNEDQLIEISDDMEPTETDFYDDTQRKIEKLIDGVFVEVDSDGEEIDPNS